MYSKIVNPVTKRKVNINGKLGKKILANYVSILNGGASPSSKKIRFDEIAEEWDPKCNLLNQKECTDPDTENSFYCKWNSWGKGKCIAIEGDDLEELYYDSIGEDFYGEIDSNSKKNIDEHNAFLRQSRLPSSAYLRENLGKKRKDEIIARQNKGEFLCGDREVNYEKCGPYNKNSVWEHPCLDDDGYCYDEDWVETNGIVHKGFNRVIAK